MNFTFYQRIIDKSSHYVYIASMKRDIESKLLDWKTSPRRKPLILRGIRQSGKTYSLKTFGRESFRDLAYFDFEQDPTLADLFGPPLQPKRLMRDLSLLRGRPIEPGKTLIVFDEIQVCPRALTSLKYFCDETPEVHVAAAGSLLGIHMSGPESFPVGKVNFLDLHPLSFLEFLSASGRDDWCELIEATREFVPFAKPLHRELIELLKVYYYVGGMPEAVDCYLQTKDFQAVRTVQKEILDAYAIDFTKHADPKDVPRIARVWASIPSQLARENKKFKYTAIANSARAREYESAVQWLWDAGIILAVFGIGRPALPLARSSDRNAFKAYLADVGLLAAMSNAPASGLVRGDALFADYRGALAENYVAQQITAHLGAGLFYWKSRGIAEVNFVVEHEGAVLPLEVKAGVNPKSKSLKAYREKYAPPALSRATLLNLQRDGEICNYPLYAISRFPLSVS